MSSSYLTKEEDLIYQLETLANYEPEDLDYPVFEVGYANELGSECFAEVCCVQLATEVLELIKQLKEDNNEH